MVDLQCTLIRNVETKENQIMSVRLVGTKQKLLNDFSSTFVLVLLPFISHWSTDLCSC